MTVVTSCVNPPQLARETLTTLELRVWHVVTQFLQPNHGFGVRGGTPITARRQRAPRPNLGAIRHAAAFELTQLEEPPQKYF